MTGILGIYTFAGLLWDGLVGLEFGMCLRIVDDMSTVLENLQPGILFTVEEVTFT